MSRIDLARILDIATDVRSVLVSAAKDELPEHWSRFPRGACGDTTLVLGALLMDAGFDGFEYTSGERGSQEDGTYSSHAWLQRSDLVVDITADQFVDGPGAIIVVENSAWHQGFHISSTDLGDFREYPVVQVVKLHSLYRYMKAKLWLEVLRTPGTGIVRI